MSTDWAKVLGMRLIKILLALIFLSLLTIACVGIFTNKPIDMWGLKFNTKETIVKHDTLESHKIIYDTLRYPTPIILTSSEKDKSPNKKNEMKIDSGGSGIQNNAPNYGNQAGRDLTVINEKELQEADKITLINLIDKLKKDSSTSTKCVLLFSSNTSNAPKVQSQISDFLTSKGYKIMGGGVSYYMGTLRGVNIGYKNGCIEITVGTL